MRVSEDILGLLIIFFAVIGILATLSHIYKALVHLNQTIKRNFRTNRAQTVFFKKVKFKSYLLFSCLVFKVNFFSNL